MKTKLMDTSITPVVTPVSAQGEDQLPYGNDPEEYQGAVRLRLEATDSVQTVISFVNTLRQKLHVRILELSGTVAGGVDVRLALRNPLDLISVLRQIEVVSTVEGPKNGAENGDERLIHVRLTENA